MNRAEQKLCAVSVDLDEIPHYAAIHGVPDIAIDEAAVYSKALPRLLRWSEALSIPLTLFAIARDCERPPARAALAEALAKGHELGNHSLDHRYDLTRLSGSEMRHQVVGAQSLFEQALGTRPIGFRAPGYTTVDALYDVLCEEGFQYSSSVFPCPPYFAAKVGAICAKRLRGKRSASVVDNPSVLRAPTSPYRVGTPYWKRGNGLLELPIQTTPWLRLPFIGTTLTLLGPARARWLTQQVVGSRFVNLELHGIDLLDRFDGLQALAPHQPDLRIALHRKHAVLNAVIETLRQAGYSFVTLASAARVFGAQASVDLTPEGCQTGEP